MKLMTNIAFSIVLLFTFSISADLQAHGKRLSLSNAKIPASNLMTGGQPSKHDIHLLALKGVKTVINLRTKGEFERFDEAAEVEKEGMKYYSLEIPGASGITKENAIKLDKLLGKERTMVHCASGNRVGALLALREYFVIGKSAKQALAFGKKSGMTRLSNVTAQLIEESESNQAQSNQAE